MITHHKTSTFFCLLALLSLAGCQPDEGQANSVTITDGSDYVPEGYELVWNDEFDYSGAPDTTRWSYQTGGFGWTAKELQNYLEADPYNVKVADGKLTITARKERVGKNDYTSTRLVTKHKGEVEYGYVEVRAKFAKGRGLRSAFWLVGSNVLEVGWPITGEIDLVEHYGQFPTVVSAAVQTKNDYWSKKGQKGGSAQLADAEEQFHVYSCTWTEDRLDFAVDGTTYYTYAPKLGIEQGAWPFTHPFYMAATLSVGGIRGPNAEVDDAAFPAEYVLDYVRVYQQKSM